MWINYFKSGLRNIRKLLIVSILFPACSTTPESGVFPVRLDRVSDGKMPLHRLCSKVELIPLETVPESPVGDLSKIAVSEDRFYIQKGSRRILVWNKDGSFSGCLEMDSDITDYSLFEDQKLELLSEYDVFEYGLPDLSQTLHLHISDKSVNLKTIARVTAKMTQIDRYGKAKDMWEERKIMMGGYADGSEYMCSYDLDNKKYSVSEGMKGESPVSSSDMEKSRFFWCGDKTYSLHASDGHIYRHSAFSGPQYVWSFEGTDGKGLRFMNAQMTPEKVYISFQKEDGQNQMLIFNRKDGRYTILRRVAGNLEFPLGVIREGVNWFCCPSAALGRYVDKNVLDDFNASILDSLVSHPGPVVIKYDL